MDSTDEELSCNFAVTKYIKDERRGFLYCGQVELPLKGLMIYQEECGQSVIQRDLFYIVHKPSKLFLNYLVIVFSNSSSDASKVFEPKKSL